MYIVTYQKSDGEIFIRPYKLHGLHTFKCIGDESSMGWKIIDIHYKHGDNYYCYADFLKIYKKEIEEKHNKKMIRFLIKLLNNSN